MNRYFGTLRIFSHKAKNGTRYKIAYWKDGFKFVHIAKEQLSYCVSGINKRNKPYIEYTGHFIVNDNDTIDI